jgi:anthranilate synthase/aminodeoxychorismate synthase-like glutamine amidotransferase
VHGKTSPVEHDGAGIFAGVSSPFEAARYHSLVVSGDGWPEALVVAATTREGIVMGLRHRQWPVHGVQFHPESILTGPGRRILMNFLRG